MDERLVKKLLIPSFIMVTLSTVFFYEVKYLIDKIFFKTKHILIIGILSAPENFHQRSSIRKTWLRLLPEISGSSYFIIGNEICEVPPFDRADPYSCIHRPFYLPKSATAETEFSTLYFVDSNPGFANTVPRFIGFGFYVRHEIIVKKLGILSEVLEIINKEVQVKLISAYDKRILASVTFSPSMINESSSKVMLKSIKPINLMARSEAKILLEVKNKDSILIPGCRDVFWEDHTKVINYINLWESTSALPQVFTEESCSSVLMIYSIEDISSLKRAIQNKKERFNKWLKYTQKLSQDLRYESKMYNDLMFLDVVDVYRNLTLKMMKFYKRIVQTEYFHYVLKTDDDSFVDILRIHNQLRSVNKKMDGEITLLVGQNVETGKVARLRLSKFWWWSYFREFWKVQHSGKWRETLYRSPSYPAFPCGGGYVINKGIVNYLASNENSLAYFQGEDVSLGIWLSSLPVIHYKIPNLVTDSLSYELQRTILTKYKGEQFWVNFKSNKSLNELVPDTCEWTCDNTAYHSLPLCNKVDLSIQSMQDAWNNYINNGYL